MTVFGHRYTWCLLVLVLGAGANAWAQSHKNCAVCEEPLRGEFYWFKSPALAEKPALCRACSQLDTQCFVCKIPVKKSFKNLEDGRLLCSIHAAIGVFDETEARRIFHELKHDLFPLLDGLGVLPNQNIAVHLVDARQMVRLNQSRAAVSGPGTVMGLTRSRTVGQGQYDHDIYLLNGVGRARLMAVAAHEYGHAWIQENVPASRQLNADTHEAFCELVALHVMTRRGETLERQIILQNAYTRGQIKSFLEADDTHQFFRVANWMKYGKNPKLPAASPTEIQTARDTSMEPTVLWALPVVKTKVPTTLQLKGISGTTRRRFALVNDLTLTQNESGKVRVGDSSLVVRCLAIKDHSVLLQVEGAAEPVELTLDIPR